MLPLLCFGIFGAVMILISIVIYRGNPFKTVIDYRVVCPKCGWHSSSSHATSAYVGWVLGRECPQCMHPAPGGGDGWKVVKMRGTPITELSNPFTWWKWRWDEVD